MKENIALFLAILYLIYRYKTYKNVNKIIEDRIENVHRPFFKRIQDVLNSIKLIIIPTHLLMRAVLKVHSQ